MIPKLLLTLVAGSPPDVRERSWLASSGSSRWNGVARMESLREGSKAQC